MRSISRMSAAIVAAFVLLFAASCAPFWVQGPDVDGGMNLTPLRTGQLVVWVSSRRQNYSTIVAASFSSDFPRTDFVQREMSPQSFLPRLKSRSPDEPAPDVAFIDNWSQVQPLLESKAVLSAWGRSRFPTSGWWVIFKDTKNLARAQAFVRWLNRPLNWAPQARNNLLSRQARDTVQRAAIAAFRALMSGDQARLDLLLDRDAARIRLMPTDFASRLSNIEPIVTFGNARIAFVLLSAVGSGDSLYGMRQVSFILRNRGDGWRILQMDPNVSLGIHDGSGFTGPPPLLRRAFDVVIKSDRDEAPPPPAELVEPADRAVLARWPERPEIAWQSAAPLDATFIVESQFMHPRDETNLSVSRLSFADTSMRKPPFRQRAPFGVGMQPHRWRIWTLLPSGAVSVSAWRTVLFSN